MTIQEKLIRNKLGLLELVPYLKNILFFRQLNAFQHKSP